MGKGKYHADPSGWEKTLRLMIEELEMKYACRVHLRLLRRHDSKGACYTHITAEAEFPSRGWLGARTVRAGGPWDTRRWSCLPAQLAHYVDLLHNRLVDAPPDDGRYTEIAPGFPAEAYQE